MTVFLDSSIFILGQNLAERMLSQRKLMKRLVGMRTIRVTGKGMIKVKPDHYIEVADTVTVIWEIL